MCVTKKVLKLKEDKKERLFFRKREYSASDIPVATIHVPKTKLINDPDNFGGDDKLSIIGDKVFKALFYNEKNLKHSAMFLSQFLNISFEEALEEIRLLKNELNVEHVEARGYVCDYVADLRDNTINIEMNNSNKFERNLIYLYLLVNRKNKVGAKELILPQAGFQFNLCNFYFDGHDKTIEYFPQKNRANELLTFNNQIAAIFIPNI